MNIKKNDRVAKIHETSKGSLLKGLKDKYLTIIHRTGGKYTPLTPTLR